jgi:TRAP-type transport system periplasmic protein
MKPGFVVPSIALVLILAGLLIMGSADPASAADPAKVWELKFAISSPEASSTVTNVFKPWTEEVAKATAGRVKIVLYPSESLCKIVDTMNAVRNGIADLGWAWAGLQTGVAPLSEVGMLPMLYTRAEPASRAIWELHETLPEVRADYKGYKLITLFTCDAYPILTNKKPVRTMKDLRGMKVRAGAPVTVEFLNRLGAAPVMVRMGDLYLAMQKGTIDAMTAGGESILAYKFYEIIRYYTFPGLMPGGHFVIMNENVWNSMPAQIQQQLMSVSGAALSSKLGRNFDAKHEEVPEVVKKAGIKAEFITLAPQEIELWKNTAAEPTWQAWADGLEKKGLAGRKVLDTMKQLLKKYGG